jgi:myo-inositol-1(or 4)-monophosphatase
MRAHLHAKKRIHASTPHDIKLELDVRCQQRIQRALQRAFPRVPIVGEEGVLGDPQAPWRWVVDPIDGTVNFASGIPHACVSVALQHEIARRPGSGGSRVRQDSGHWSGYRSVIGVVYDPFANELWTAVRGQPARVNGRIIHVTDRRTLGEAIVSIGFSDNRATLEQMRPVFNALLHRVRKLRIMGSAALGLTYVASGRMDAYFELGLNLWDIAAGGLIIECAGGEFFHRSGPGTGKYQVVASNGHLRQSLQRASR